MEGRSEINGPKKPFGTIKLILGPMFSGKTSELIRLSKIETIRCKKILYVKYKGDVRYGDNKYIVSHDGHKIRAVYVERLSELPEVLSRLSNVPEFDLENLNVQEQDIVMIDEGQFFDDIVEFCHAMTKKGVNFIISALNSKYDGSEWKNVSGLVAISEDIVKLNSVCTQCKGVGSFTFRKVSSNEDRLIGGPESYMTVCRTCWYDLKGNLKSTNDCCYRIQ
jgi:thymidine kinase